LNGVVTFEEAQQCMGLSTGKAADLQGFTGELLHLAASTDSNPSAPQPICPQAIECAQWLLQSMLDNTCIPASLCTSKLVPVPKAKDPAALMDRDMHRGISVSAVFARLLERMMNKRLERVVTQLQLRSPTQCGFRPGHGTLDAIFTLQHLIHSAQHTRQRLYVVFVDFKKAFDMVRRDLLLERCQQLGIHGPFMAMLVKLYDSVCSQVVVNGQVGDPIVTTTGTKQGSELSPLLFGLFIELLHDMIRLRLPGAGPVLSGMHVPDVEYADDVALVSLDPAQAQQLLDILGIFCRIFGMEVNLAPHKTCVVVFRRARTAIPAGFRLTYRGCEVAQQSEYTYLGVRVHETRGLANAGTALAGAGSKAMHAVLGRCRRANLTQFDIKLRMFDVLVEPVLSYASHIWGPLAFQKHLRARPYATDSEKVHTSYLRIMAGAGRSASLDVLYRDLHRLPVMYHWVILAVRWWNRMSAAHGGELALACCAWLEDVKLALAGCSACWASMLLHTLSSLQLVDCTWRTQGLDWVLGQRWEEDAVKQALAALFQDRWRGPFDHDPRLAPSLGVSMCQHSRWVYPVDPTVDCYTRADAPKHTRLCLPFARLRNYAQLRIGYAHLEIEQGRKRRPATPRAHRTCKLCSGEDALLSHRQLVLSRTGRADNVEDLKHFVLECPVYDDLRTACVVFPTDVYSRLDSPTCMVDVFSHDNQAALANTLYHMKVRRAELLGLTMGI
jgi:sorting nexin-29